jgi:hypothetical protein
MSSAFRSNKFFSTKAIFSLDNLLALVTSSVNMKAATSTFPVKLEKGLLRMARKQAESEQRTLASLIRFLLVQYLKDKQ